MSVLPFFVKELRAMCPAEKIGFPAYFAVRWWWWW